MPTPSAPTNIPPQAVASRWDEHPNDPRGDPEFQHAEARAEARALSLLSNCWTVATLLWVLAIPFCLGEGIRLGNENLTTEVVVFDRFFSAAGLLTTLAPIFCVVLVWFCWKMGRFLRERRQYAFCRTIALLSFAFFPLGTLLGYLTVRLLSRPSVRASFHRPAAHPRAATSSRSSP